MDVCVDDQQTQMLIIYFGSILVGFFLVRYWHIGGAKLWYVCVQRIWPHWSEIYATPLVLGARAYCTYFFQEKCKRTCFEPLFSPTSESVKMPLGMCTICKKKHPAAVSPKTTQYNKKKIYNQLGLQYFLLDFFFWSIHFTNSPKIEIVYRNDHI